MKDARKREAQVGEKSKFAKALCREEPVKRSSNYRRGVKRELSKVRRSVDRQAIQEDSQT